MAAIGIAIGGGLYLPAAAATAFALILLAVLRPFEKRLARRWHKTVITAFYDRAQLSASQLMAAVDAAGAQTERLSLIESGVPNRGQAEIVLAAGRMNGSVERALQGLMELPGVHRESIPS
ncbi:MAG: hypothetical protein ACRD5L_15535 [Bryobacteraceae bacterium]